MPVALMQGPFHRMINNEKGAKIMLDIPSLMKNAINDHLTLKLLDICFDNMLQILCKSLVYIAQIWEIDYRKLPKLCL